MDVGQHGTHKKGWMTHKFVKLDSIDGIFSHLAAIGLLRFPPVRLRLTYPGGLFQKTIKFMAWNVAHPHSSALLLVSRSRRTEESLLLRTWSFGMWSFASWNVQWSKQMYYHVVQILDAPIVTRHLMISLTVVRIMFAFQFFCCALSPLVMSEKPVETIVHGVHFFPKLVLANGAACWITVEVRLNALLL